tara:strand:+ start:729 stop:1574 length:846 start_codon:yes stop_codon:yes gene_type:complete
MWGDQFITAVVYVGSAFGVFVLGHFAFGLARRDYSVREELIEKDNLALSLTLVGYYLGLVVAIGGVMAGPSAGLEEDLIDILVYGILAVILLNCSAVINDRFILSRFQIRKEILEDQNCGTGAVELAVFVASGLNIHGAVYGHGGSVLTAVGFWALGQLVLMIVGRYYNAITSYDIHEHIEKDNVAVGVGFAGALIAMGNLLRVASGNDFVSWIDNFGDFCGTMAVGIILLPLARVLTDRILFPGRALADELVNQEKPNLGAGFLEAASYIGSSFLIVWAV